MTGPPPSSPLFPSTTLFRSNDSTSVINSAPTATVDLPATALTNDTITAVTTSADADGDTVTLGYVWKITRAGDTCTLNNTISTLDLSASFSTSACTGAALGSVNRSEERRVGKEGRSRGSPYH